MKTLLTAVLAFASIFALAQPWQTINGNGKAAKETRSVSDFTGVASASSIDVQISYGNSKAVSVEADENLLPYIETEVNNGVLHIRAKKNINLKSKNKMRVQFSMTRLTSCKLSGSGNIRGEGDFSNNGLTEISVSGSGNIDLDFDNISELKLAIAGSGNIDLDGDQCNNIDASISGSGNIDCSDVRCNDVFAKISGSGNIKVNAHKSIDAKVSGSGNVYYKGDASNINSKTAGSGKIVRM